MRTTLDTPRADGRAALGAVPGDASRTERAAGVERRPRLVVLHALLLLLATCAHWLPRLSGPIDLRYDAGVYYVLGTSLAEGRGYRLLNEPGAIHAIQYPPLLPAWVALHQLALGTDDPLVVGKALRASSFVLSLLYALAALALARRHLRPWPAFLAALLAVLHFHTVFLQDLCFSEVPFALVTLGFFLAHGSASARRRALAPGLAVLAFLLRSAGIALLAAWTLEALVAREWRRLAGRTLVAGACVLAWQGWVWSVTHGPEYRAPAYAYQRAPYQFYNVSYAENVALRDPFAPEKGRITALALARRSLANAPRLVLGLGESVSAPQGCWEWPLRSMARRTGVELPHGPIRLVLGLLGLVVLSGLGLLYREGRVVLALFVACSLGLVALLPWPSQFERYLTPLVPLLALALLRALQALPARASGYAASGVAALVILQGDTLRRTFAVYHHELRLQGAAAEPVAARAFLFEEKENWRAFYDALGWLARHTPTDALVASTSPHLVWLHARRQAIMPPYEADAERAAALLDSAAVDLVVLDRLAFLDVVERYARPALARHPERWECVYADPDGRIEILRRRRAP